MIAKLIKKEHLANDIISFYFKPERKMRFVAGQFVDVTIPNSKRDNRGTKRWFTLSSSPAKEYTCITTRIFSEPSSFKKDLNSLKIGDTIEISEPMGDFVLPRNVKTPLVFIAGGIGITPYHSMVEYLNDNYETRKIQLIYIVKNKEDLIFNETFSKEYINLIPWINKEKLTVNKITELVNGIDNKQIYISGPEPMVEDIVEQYKSIGITQDQLITDYFPGYTF